MKSGARSLLGVRTPGPPGHRAVLQERTAFVVGITGDGYVPVVEDWDGARGAPVVGLPCLVVEAPPAHAMDEIRERVAAGLVKEFGYEAQELVAMERRPSGPYSGGPAFLLAPLVSLAGWRAGFGFVPGVYEVALSAIPEWLRQRRLAGAVESPSLREGLLLAREHFPRWASERVGRALRQLRCRSGHEVVSA